MEKITEICRNLWAWLANIERHAAACVHDYQPCGERHYEREFGGDVLISRCRLCPAWMVDRSYVDTVTMRAVR